MDFNQEKHIMDLSTFQLVLWVQLFSRARDLEVKIISACQARRGCKRKSTGKCTLYKTMIQCYNTNQTH